MDSLGSVIRRAAPRKTFLRQRSGLGPFGGNLMIDLRGKDAALYSICRSASISPRIV
jgi:hypothetical protein